MVDVGAAAQQLAQPSDVAFERGVVQIDTPHPIDCVGRPFAQLSPAMPHEQTWSHAPATPSRRSLRRRQRRRALASRGGTAQLRPAVEG